MINLLEGYKGSLEVNGNAYNDLKAAVQALKGFEGELVVVLNKGAKIEEELYLEDRRMD
jgi:MinD superfamily P-loop ATPase